MAKSLPAKSLPAKSLPAKSVSVQKRPSATVTLKHLAAAVAESHDLSRKQAEGVLGDIVGQIVKHLKKGERVKMQGLGILQVKKRAARVGRNPATGEQIKIKASKKVAFRSTRELKEAIGGAKRLGPPGGGGGSQKWP